MIKVREILKSEKVCSCDNCNRIMPLVLEYSFSDDKDKEYNKLTLCEDCGNAMSNMFYKVMENGESFKYELDEIKRA